MKYSFVVRNILLLVDDETGTPLLACFEPLGLKLEDRAESLIAHAEFSEEWLALAAKMEDVFYFRCEGDPKIFFRHLMIVDSNAKEEDDDRMAAANTWGDCELQHCPQMHFAFSEENMNL